MRLRLVLLCLVALLAGCGSHRTAPTSAASAQPSAAATAATTAPAPATAVASGKDAIGGSVTANLGHEPVLVVPTAPAPGKLLTKDIVVGKGAEAGVTSTVTVQYLGVDYQGGKAFDSSWSRGQPAQFPLSGVVPGFAQGIAGMRVGGRREIVIPPALGYGPAGQPPVIGPDETLIFVVDLLSVS